VPQANSKLLKLGMEARVQAAALLLLPRPLPAPRPQLGLLGTGEYLRGTTSSLACPPQSSSATLLKQQLPRLPLLLLPVMVLRTQLLLMTPHPMWH
jgi:hypothetical protein